MKKIIIFIGIFIFSFLSVKGELSGPAYGDTIIISSIGDASFLNPLLATDSSSSEINSYIYNGLVKYDKDLILVGDLAQNWEVSEDGLVITFYLRKNVYWHDGKHFTAEDVEFTYQKLISPDTRTPFSSDYLLIKKFEVLNDYKIKITYKQPFSPALESWGIGIIPKHIFSKGDINNHPANRKPIGTGPYKFVEWLPEEKIVLEFNQNYFEGRPYINRIIYRIIPDPAVQFMELQRESIDMMSLTPDQYKKESETGWFKKHYQKFRYPSFSYTYIAYNLNNPLFKEKKVRQALSYAINKQEIIEGVLLGLGEIATGPYPSSYWAYNPAVKPYPYDPVKAKKLLKECGWEDTNQDGILEKNGKKFEFTLITNQGNKTREMVAQMVQEYWAKIGVKINIRILEWSAFLHQYVDTKNFDALILGWSLSLDPDQYSIWHSSQIGEGEYNFVSYSNPQVDKLLEEGRRTFDLSKRKEIYHKFHQIIAEDQPYTFLYVADSLPIVHQRFKGIEAAPAGISYNFIKWYVPQKEQKYKW